MIKNELFNLEGETVLVTGGGSGLGRGFALTLAFAGAKVIACGRTQEKLEETVQLIKDSGGVAFALHLDITDHDSIKQCIRAAHEISPITILINNAGIPTNTILQDTTEEVWDGVFETNLKGVWLLCNETLRYWIDLEIEGNIINISSVLASCVQQGTGPYSASKSALEHLTRIMAYEWAPHGVRVNAISPGYFHTNLSGGFLNSRKGKELEKRVPQKRFGKPKDLDGAILLLSSAASSYMTGSVICVDGGLSIAVI